MRSALIVDDNTSLISSLTAALADVDRLELDSACCLEQACLAVDNSFYDLVILDWLLPDGSGTELIDYLHDYSYQTKILMLTKKEQTKNRLTAFNKGADAYLSKPFSTQELLVNCRLLLNRFKLTGRDMITTPALAINTRAGIINCDDRQVSLPKKELEILKILVLNAPRVVSKQSLINQIWTELDHQPQLNTIEVYVRRIRMKLGNLGGLIKTKRGFGYFFDQT